MTRKKQSRKKSEIGALRDDVRGLGVLVEQTNHNVELLVEGHAVLDKKIDTVHNDLKEFKKEVDYKFGVVFDELHIIREQTVKRDEFSLLEKRVLAIEKKIAHQK